MSKRSTSKRRRYNRVKNTVNNKQKVANTQNNSTVTKLSSTNMQIALPKVREPLSSLKDKNIPFNFEDPEELKKIRYWARMFYATHDLVPLLVDIYSTFPTAGLEFVCKDDDIAEFYRDMFMDPEKLNYENFLKEIGKEFFISGECTILGHFDEVNGVWESEEILNPDNVIVSRSHFSSDEQVLLDVSPIVEDLRTNSLESSTKVRKDKQEQMKMLEHFYPEIIDAATSGDGLELSPDLVSRMANKISPWDLRGTPHMLRSFQTLMLEESLNAAQDAVADRLYSPFILGNLGIKDIDGTGVPWVPTQEELNNVRDLMQQALAADFRMLIHHFGFDIKSVFGRESVPRFDQDFDRITKKLLQAWGIGESLISGSSGGPYASSALNREFVTQMMTNFQQHIKTHMKKRMKIVAEVQGHYDYEEIDGQKQYITESVLRKNPETGEIEEVQEYILLIPEVRFATLNLRDEAQERQFLLQLKAAGVPISDKALAVNLPVDMDEENDSIFEETVKKYLNEATAKKRALEAIKEKGLPVPPELAAYFMQSEQSMMQIKQMEYQREMMNSQEAQGINPAETMDFVNRGGRPSTTTPQDGPQKGRPDISNGGSDYGPGDAMRAMESDEMRFEMPKTSSVDQSLINFIMMKTNRPFSTVEYDEYLDAKYDGNENWKSDYGITFEELEEILSEIQ